MLRITAKPYLPTIGSIAKVIKAEDGKGGIVIYSKYLASSLSVCCAGPLLQLMRSCSLTPDNRNNNNRWPQPPQNISLLNAFNYYPLLIVRFRTWVVSEVALDNNTAHVSGIQLFILASANFLIIPIKSTFYLQWIPLYPFFSTTNNPPTNHFSKAITVLLEESK